MKFGIVLLFLIGILCIIATIFEIGSIYSSWYFVSLFVFLIFNLFFCSVVRVKNISLWKNNLLEQAKKGYANIGVAEAEKWLKNHGFKRCGDVYIRNGFGLYGTFIVHLAVLFVMLAAACIFTFSDYIDYVIPVGTSQILEDGTLITVESFSMVDENEDVEYKSDIVIETTDAAAEKYEVLVNHPVSFGCYKIYQQNYVYAASIGVKTDVGEEEMVYLDEPAFLSLDDMNGICYLSLFTDVAEEDGEIRVTHSSDLINPAYEIKVIKKENVEYKLAYPGSVIEVGGVTYAFYEPEICTGLRIKKYSQWSMIMLYTSFVMLLVGLYSCLFCDSEAAAIKENGISFVSRKNSEQRLVLYLNEIESNKEKALKDDREVRC